MIVSNLNKKDQKSKIKQLVADLNSGIPKQISSALKELQLHGDISILRPLVELLKTDLPPATQTEILFFLADVSTSKATVEMMAILKDESLLPQRQIVLSTIWNSKLDYSPYIAEFVEIACEGNFLEALDCLTIIENLEGPFEEHHILECQLHLKDYLESNDPKEEKKAQMLSEIGQLIRSLDRNLDDF
jgi:hypothetical protein